MPATQPSLQSAVLVLNQERLFGQSQFGQRVQRELEAAAQALAAENRAIEAQLTEEELRLTDLRPTMEPAEFRVLADEFDSRVDGIRAAQDAKGRDIQAQAEAAQTQFFDLATPVLLDIVRARGAAVLLDSRGVLLSADVIDITEIARARIDATLGEGDDAPLVSIGQDPDAPALDPVPNTPQDSPSD